MSDGQVDCGECPHTRGCPAGHCWRAREREAEAALPFLWTWNPCGMVRSTGGEFLKLTRGGPPADGFLRDLEALCRAHGVQVEAGCVTRGDGWDCQATFSQRQASRALSLRRRNL